MRSAIHNRTGSLSDDVILGEFILIIGPEPYVCLEVVPFDALVECLLRKLCEVVDPSLPWSGLPPGST